MRKVIVRKQKNAASSKESGKTKSVVTKRVRDEHGGTRTLRKVDVVSPTFSSDLTYVFSKNVEKARKENRHVMGVSDGDITPR